MPGIQGSFCSIVLLPTASTNGTTIAACGYHVSPTPLPSSGICVVGYIIERATVALIPFISLSFSAMLTPTTSERAASLKAEGNALFKAKDHRGAYEKYTQAISLDDKNAILYCNRSACSLALQRRLDAAEDADTVCGWMHGCCCGAHFDCRRCRPPSSILPMSRHGHGSLQPERQVPQIS